MSAEPDYYEVLGLPANATPDQIKKRYRELARRFHPDVNPSPEAAQKIKGINEAYHILGDPDRRAVFDADRLLRSNNPTRPVPTQPRTAPNPRPAPARPQDMPGSADFNGFGRTARDTGSTPTAPPRRTPPSPNPGPQRPAPSHSATNPFGTVDRMVNEARLAFINHRYKEAENLCHQALAIDRRNATAHEILGDICLKRGQRNSAATCYSYAVQLNPRNMSVQDKLYRLLGPPGGSGRPSPGPTMTRPVPTPAWKPFVEGPVRDNTLSVITTLLVLAFFTLLVLVSEHPGLPRQSLQIPLPFLSDLSLNLMAALAMQGVVSGILLAFHGNMRPIVEELLTYHATRSGRRMPVPLGTLLTLSACIWFYVSAIVYVAIGIAQDRFSTSVLRVYGATLALVLLFALLYKPTGAPYGGLQTIAFGGNILFPTMLLGWAIGDAIRLRRA